MSAVFAAAIAGVAYYERIYLPQQLAIAESKAKGAAQAAENARVEAKARAEADATAKRRAQRLPQLAEQLKRLQSSKPGSRAEQLAREDAIATALQMDPTPDIAPNAQVLFDRGHADLKAAAATDDYRRAAAELGRALRIAPWYASGWTALADANEGANDLNAAAAALRVYLIAAPTAADTASVNARLSQLEQQEVQERQKAEDQRKLAELKRQEQQKQAEIDKQQQAEKERQQQEQAR